MLNSYDIQEKYIALYRNLRNYAWEADVVEIIADMEIAIYTAFPDIQFIKQCIYDLTREIADVLAEDEELKSSLEELTELIYSEDVKYMPISVVKEAML